MSELTPKKLGHNFLNIMVGQWINVPHAPVPLPLEGESSARGRQVQYFEAYRLFGEALVATGRNITYSICPLIARCDESIWTYTSVIPYARCLLRIYASPWLARWICNKEIDIT